MAGKPQDTAAKATPARKPRQPKPAAKTPETDESREAVEKEITDTREALGGTVDALAAKADVKSRVKDQAIERGRAVRSKGVQLKDQTGQVAASAWNAVPDGPRRIVTNAVRLVRPQAKKIAAAGGTVAAVVVLRSLIRRRRSHGRR